MNDFGEYLRKLREEQRWSLRQVAAKTGVSVSYITLIENGKKKSSRTRNFEKNWRLFIKCQ